MICGFLPLRKTLERRPVYHEHIQPAIRVVVNERDTAAGGFDDVLLVEVGTGDMTCRQTRFAGDILKIDFRERELELDIGSSASHTTRNRHSLAKQRQSRRNAQDGKER